jgi:hypothetical protein
MVIHQGCKCKILILQKGAIFFNFTSQLLYQTIGLHRISTQCHLLVVAYQAIKHNWKKKQVWWKKTIASLIAGAATKNKLNILLVLLCFSKNGLSRLAWIQYSELHQIHRSTWLQSPVMIKHSIAGRLYALAVGSMVWLHTAIILDNALNKKRKTQ